MTRHYVTPTPDDDNGMRVAAGQVAWNSGQLLDTAHVDSPWISYGWCYSALQDLCAAILYEDIDRARELAERIRPIFPPINSTKPT